MAKDTIVARATAAGQGGIGVVRVSGPQVPQIAQQILGKLPSPRLVQLATFWNAKDQPIDMGVVLYFDAPHSFTGEHVLELQGHGGPVVMAMLVTRCVELGARLARPGEFSERAYLNDKMDLAQAEAVADLISAQSAAGARGALRSLQGEFSRRVQSLQQALTELRVYIEAALDFPDEEIDFVSDSVVRNGVNCLQSQLELLISHAEQGVRMRDGLQLVLLGAPNVGKSSLLNALVERESAIVTPIPGTTRDLLREDILLDGLPLHIIDTAGLHASEDLIELEGMRRARAAADEADRILLIIDDQQGISSEDEALLRSFPSHIPVTLLLNKIDLTHRTPGFAHEFDYVALAISAQTGLGLEQLKQHLLASAGMQQSSESPFMARQRHLLALRQAQQAVAQGWQQLQQRQAAELLAEDLRQAQLCLAEITGELSSDELLGKIFSEFCIGK